MDEIWLPFARNNNVGIEHYYIRWIPTMRIPKRECSLIIHLFVFDQSLVKIRATKLQSLLKMNTTLIEFINSLYIKRIVALYKAYMEGL
jgi:hypothetical protein